MPRTRSSSKNNNSTANLGFEATVGNTSIYSQDKLPRGKRRFGLANRARRVRLMGNQPKQSNPTTRRLAVMNLALRGINHLAPHGMAGLVLARFWLWVEHGFHRANSREETGRALCAFNATDMRWRIGLYSGRIFS